MLDLLVGGYLVFYAALLIRQSVRSGAAGQIQRNFRALRFSLRRVPSPIREIAPPVPAPAQFTAVDADLRETDFVFRRVIEVYLTLSDRWKPVYIYTDGAGTSASAMFNPDGTRQIIQFSTLFADGAYIETTTPIGETIETRDYVQRYARTFVMAERYHRRRVADWISNGRTPRPVDTIDEQREAMHLTTARYRVIQTARARRDNIRVIGLVAATLILPALLILSALLRLWIPAFVLLGLYFVNGALMRRQLDAMRTHALRPPGAIEDTLK